MFVVSNSIFVASSPIFVASDLMLWPAMIPVGARCFEAVPTAILLFVSSAWFPHQYTRYRVWVKHGVIKSVHGYGR